MYGLFVNIHILVHIGLYSPSKWPYMINDIEQRTKNLSGNFLFFIWKNNLWTSNYPKKSNMADFISDNDGLSLVS